MTIPSSALTSTASIILMPIFLARPGQEANLERALHDLQTLSRTDDGCIDYSVFVDSSDEGRFVLHEEWVNQEALDAHNLQAHVIDFVAQTDALLREPFTVARMRRIGE